MERKKQAMVSRPIAETEYRVMADVTCDPIWIIDSLDELHPLPPSPMRLYRDNKANIHIGENLFFMSAQSILRWIIICAPNGNGGQDHSDSICFLC